ncbi:MAG: IS701 family transposase, partial [Candidatus Desulforudaceae bacterium]
MTTSTWEADNVQKEHQIRLGEKISDEDGMFTVDSSEIPKKGRDSAGVARQYCGHLGKIENCQSGVFLGYAGKKGYGLLGGRLYVPEQWFSEEYAERREKCHFPEDLSFQTKPQIAFALLQKAKETGAFWGRWVGCDSMFGNDPAVLDAVGEEYRYFAELRSNTRVWLERPEIGIPPYKGRGPRPKKEKPLTDPVPVSEVANAPALPWITVNMGEGAKGP